MDEMRVSRPIGGIKNLKIREKSDWVDGRCLRSCRSGEFKKMPQEEKAADVVRREEGYTLYDLVSMADSAELDRLDDETLLRTSPHILSVFLSRLDVDTQRQILRRFSPSRSRR